MNGVAKQPFGFVKQMKNVVIESWVHDVAKAYSTCLVFLAPLLSAM
jgi:hypothetical protein